LVDLVVVAALVVVVVAVEVETVAPVLTAVVVATVVEVAGGASQLVVMRTSAQFQNCSGTPLPSGGSGPQSLSISSFGLKKPGIGS